MAGAVQGHPGLTRAPGAAGGSCRKCPGTSERPEQEADRETDHEAVFPPDGPRDCFPRGRPRQRPEAGPRSNNARNGRRIGKRPRGCFPAECSGGLFPAKKATAAAPGQTAPASGRRPGRRRGLLRRPGLYRERAASSGVDASCTRHRPVSASLPRVRTRVWTPSPPAILTPSPPAAEAKPGPLRTPCAKPHSPPPLRPFARRPKTRRLSHSGHSLATGSPGTLDPGERLGEPGPTPR